MRFYSALVILEPQIYVVLEQFGAEIISLLSGRLVLILITFFQKKVTEKFELSRMITSKNFVIVIRISVSRSKLTLWFRKTR